MHIGHLDLICFICLAIPTTRSKKEDRLDPNEFFKNTKIDGYSNAPGDEDKFCAVPSTDGLLDFHVPSAALATISGMLQLPIRLVNGKHFGSGGGYGIAHMLYHHDKSFSLWDFHSVQDYVDHVLEGFDAVYLGRDNRHLVVRRKEPALAVDRLLVLELSKAKDYYSVVTGWLASARRPVNGVLIAEIIKKDRVMVWESRAPHSKRPG
jgi:hypothetical protein